MDEELKEVHELWVSLREEFVRDWLNKEGAYGGGYAQMDDDEELVLYRLATALRAERAAGRAEAKAEALRMAAGQMTWVEENSYAAQVDLRARIVAAIEAIP